VPVIQAWPEITGMIAGRPASAVSPAMWHAKREPMIERAK
jgi:hypothetical protein